ncbi:hypothetical protein MSG28_005011 [Choristoneura fumiferana]|uniref:Uncharacterized protein n=1 Tax=Choristoneura fumiferana TaxID=7141 RepID=A0ACC0JPQ8_CHOFU|nr:hypothetical protein MSG28_005011 [Choristoneura fumiferana]
MALPNESVRSFRLYVTHVDEDGHFLKISGQLDQPSSLMVESLFDAARENLEKGVGSVTTSAIQQGMICAAKYKDGTYYRAKIINTSNLSTGFVGVHFIDYGNKDLISLSAIRCLDKYDPMFLQLPGQATDYYLARIMHPSGRWDNQLLFKLQSLLCYAEYPVTVEGQSTNPIISIQFKGTDFSTHLVSNRFGIAVAVAKQEVLMLERFQQHSGIGNQQGMWQQISLPESPSYAEHVPFLVNQNFPSNPASAMRLQQHTTVPFNGAMVPAPSAISQRLIVNKAMRGPVNLRAPIRQPQVAPKSPPILPGTAPPATPAAASKNSLSPKKSSTYKSRLLEINSQHKVYVSFAEEGPELFAVQLTQDAKKLQDMMDEINKRPHSSLAEPPMIGTVCLGRMSGDRVICRAIVMNLSGSQCKLFFVDFGDTEMVSYYDIFDIPEEFVKPNVFAMRFCLSGVKKLEKGPYLNEAFKQLVNTKVMTLRVVAPEGPPLIQYGELYLDGKNVLELLMANMKDKLQFKWMEMLTLGSKFSVLVSYVDSCLKFYIQLSEQIDALNDVMDAVKAHCESTSSPGELPLGAACCARFPDDGNWYRARIRGNKGEKVIVAYVDYGNEQEVEVSDLRTITPELIQLPAQALKCALKGFESKPAETKTSNQLEMLALEKTLTANIVGVLSSDTMLVSLVDETVSPPLDVARKMNQLSQPRSNTEIKPAPASKAAAEPYSSPEGSVPDDSRRKGFKREKSFKEEWRPPREGNDEFGQRGGSFRNRRGGKPWESNAAPAPADEWEDAPAQPPRQNFRDNRDNRRKPRPDQQDKAGQRPAWKHKDSSGVGKRLKQAAEAASADTQKVHTKGSAVQDRLKRDNKFNKQDEWEEKKTDEWGSGSARENRPDRFERRDNRDNRDNRERGDRRDNWADKKDWNQKRDFRDNRNDRDNRGERGERTRSNFTPRDRADRAERSFGSDCDKRSERSYGSGKDRAGRAPPYKPRSKFTQVQYKELSDPVPLETPFADPTVESGAQHEVSVTWIISPQNFFTQIMSLQPKFLEMMHKIPELYKGVKSFTGTVPVGASVLARFPDDGVLYRATVVAVQPFSKFIVQYVDFGNKQLVDAKDIWQLDSQLMELPKMAIHCSLVGVAPKDGEWKANPEIDLCFNAPRYQCVFQDCVEGLYQVSLWNNGASVMDMLAEKQLIPCRVTHVESFEKFYVQLDLEKATLVENAIANFDVSLHEGKIYRAILNDTSDPSKVCAVLPDYGNTITTTLDNLMILPTELSVYYYQSLECCLNNYTSESKALLSLEELKARLTGNNFIVYIDSVAGISLVTTLYDITTGTPEALTTFEPDTLCAAKSSDENWYRAAIVSATETEAKVQFPDYGNTETVSKDLIKVLDPSFYEPCAQALVASLGLVALQESATEKLTEWTTEKEVQVTLAFGADGWLASLHLDGVDLSMKLVEEKLATPRVAPEEVESAPEAAPVAEPEPISLPPGCTQVYISHIDTPGHFWLQMADKIDKIEEIQAELKANADSYEDLETREMNTLCVAKYSADDLWYRAEVLDLDSDITTVRFIDYGNTDVLDNQPGVIKKMPEGMTHVEPYAVKSSVNAVPTGTGQWSEPAAESFEALVGDTEAPVDALIVLKDVVTYVDLFVGGRNVTDQLVEQGHAARAEQPECGDLPSCFASHVNSPSEFWIQLESAAPELQAMETAMVDAENFPELAAREEGVLCAAKYPEDGAWYRAQVIVDGSEGTEVLFMDYGNASIATELRSMPAELKLKPALSRKCALQKPRDIKSWSRKSEVKFNELAAEGATIFNVQFIASGDISIVELYLEGKSVTEELVGLCEEQPPAERPTPVGQDLHSTGKICYVHAVDEFYVHLDDKTAELDKVTEVMCDAPEFEQMEELKVGSICAAFWAEDEQWYRGKILEFCDASYHVHFIDYGNKAKCEEFRQLPAEVSGIEALAKCCRLAGVDAAAASAASRRLDHLMANDTPFHIEFLDNTNDPALVKLLIDGEDISTTIVTSKPSEIETKDDVDTSSDALANSTEKSVASQLSESQLEETVSEIAISNDNEVAKVNLEKSVSETVVAKDIEVAKDKNDSESTMVVNNEASMEVTPEETEQVINKNIESVLTLDSERQTNNATESLETNLEEDDRFEDAKEMNTSQPDLDESLESNHTVIENKSFEANLESLNDSEEKIEPLESPKRDTSSETLEDSNDTIKTPEREQSKDSIVTDDTGYTSNVDVSIKDSPVKESSGDSLEKTDKKVTTEKLESVEKKAEDNEVKMEPKADVTLKETSEILADSIPIKDTKVVAEVETAN